MLEKKEVDRPKEGNPVNDRCKTQLAKNNTWARCGDTCNSSTWEAEVGGSGIGLHKEFEASLGYLSTYLKK